MSKFFVISFLFSHLGLVCRAIIVENFPSPPPPKAHSKTIISGDM